MGVAARHPAARGQHELPLECVAPGLRGRRADRDLLPAERVLDDVPAGRHSRLLIRWHRDQVTSRATVVRAAATAIRIATAASSTVAAANGSGTAQVDAPLAGPKAAPPSRAPARVVAVV